MIQTFIPTWIFKGNLPNVGKLTEVFQRMGWVAEDVPGDTDRASGKTADRRLSRGAIFSNK